MSDIELGPCKQWSFSRLSNFEQCPKKIENAVVLKLAKPERDDSHAAERGINIHNDCEAYVKGEGPETHEMRFFLDQMESLKQAYEAGEVSVEGDWGFDIDWQEAGWWDKNVWARIKLDAFRRFDKTTALVVDYKSGKKMGNEVKHTQQAQLYMIAAFMRYPELEIIDTDFYYLDQKSNNRLKKTYTRNKLPIYLKKFTQRALKLTTATVFPAKPSKMNCRWCDYGPENGTGECPYGVPND